VAKEPFLFPLNKQLPAALLPPIEIGRFPPIKRRSAKHGKEKK